MSRYLAAMSVVIASGTLLELPAQEKTKERTGTVTGEYKTRKDAKNSRSVTLEILAPGESYEF